jgi:hypothetical protein
MLLIDRRMLGAKNDIRDAQPVWDYSRQPFVKMQEHNRVGLFVHGSKKTKAAASHYILLALVGPFASHAGVFAKTMESKHGAQMSCAHQVACAAALATAWNTDVKPGHPPVRFFVEDCFVDAFQQCISAQNALLSLKLISFAKHCYDKVLLPPSRKKQRKKQATKREFEEE